MRRLLIVLPLALLALPASASAATTCSLNTVTRVMTVTVGTEADNARITRDGTAINVRNNSTDVACTNNPTVSNTDDIVVNEAAGITSTVTLDLSGGQFAPGFSDEELLTPEQIEIDVNLGDEPSGNDNLDIAGGPGNDSWLWGANGINLNVDESDQDVDVTFSGQELLRFFPGAGNNTVDGRGGGSIGAPSTARTVMTAQAGNDILIGGAGIDDVTPAAGNDQVNGAGGQDLVHQVNGSGDDSVEGGPGNDTVTYQNVTTPIRADLGVTTQQDTGGGGRDRLLTLENVTGGQASDVLIGNDAGNQLGAQDGDDLMIGRGGDDVYFGGDGVDTASYELPPAGATQGIKLDLDIQPTTPGLQGDPQVTGGAGTDRISGTENLRGSPFADQLLGDENANTITGLGGADTVTARDGADVLELRDGARDTASCGGGADRAVSDVAGVDALNADCETREFDFRPETTLTGGPPAVSRDRTPTFTFTGTKSGTFECRVDGAAFAACTSAHTTASLRDGSHTFEVRRRDLLGALDLTPAARTFRVDRGKPTVGKASIAKVFKVGKKRTRLSAVKRGTTIRYRLSEASSVRITFQRKKGKRYRKVRGTIRRKGKKGANKLAFSGRLGKKALKPGRYRAVLTATDAAGNRSKAKRLSFRIVR